jgi:hypothetical protein
VKWLVKKNAFATSVILPNYLKKPFYPTKIDSTNELKSGNTEVFTCIGQGGNDV